MISIKTIFKVPSAKQVAERELEEARRSLIKSETSAIYHSKMAEYEVERIAILRKHTQPEARPAGFP